MPAWLKHNCIASRKKSVGDSMTVKKLVGVSSMSGYMYLGSGQLRLDSTLESSLIWWDWTGMFHEPSWNASVLAGRRAGESD